MRSDMCTFSKTQQQKKKMCDQPPNHRLCVQAFNHSALLILAFNTQTLPELLYETVRTCFSDRIQLTYRLTCHCRWNNAAHRTAAGHKQLMLQETVNVCPLRQDVAGIISQKPASRKKTSFLGSVSVTVSFFRAAPLLRRLRTECASVTLLAYTYI